MKNLLLSQLILFLYFSLSAQAPSESINGKWFRIDESNRNLNDKDDNKKKHFNLDEKSELQIIRFQRDNSGRKHTRSQQYYKGIKVANAIFCLHEKNTKRYSANGHLIEDLSLSVIPGISKYAARNIALNYIPSRQYAWESKEVEQLLKDSKNNPNATFFPEGELLVFSPDFQNTTAKLAYEFEIYSLNPHRRIKLFIDAHTGGILSETDLIHYCTEPCEVSCTGHTRYNGTRSITCLENNNEYVLKTENVETRNGSPQNISVWHPFMEWNPHNHFYNPLGYSYKNNSSDWGSSDSVAIGVHWASEQWYDYMYNIHNWNSYDGQGGKIINLVHYGQQMSNAFWNGAWAIYGDGNNNPYTSLDIVAHEISHGFIQSTANLIYHGESGALNESFADIFAVLIEHYALGSNANWIIGEDITGDTIGLRNMSEPMLYKGISWDYGAGDHGGVHTNSGVQNHWFYLLSNEIGMDSTAKICFYSLMNYLTPYSNYEDAKNASIQAALDLYGPNVASIVCAKWSEVGLDDCQGTENISITKPLISDVLVVGRPLTISWTKTDNISHVDIEYQINNMDWQIITNNISDTIYVWDVPGLITGSDISIRVTDASNNAILDSITLPILIECPTTVAFVENNSNYICLGHTVSFNNISVNAANYEWWINGVHYNTDTNLQWTADIVGESEIELRAYNTIGCYNSAYKNVFVADSTNMTTEFTYQKQGMNVLFSASHPDPYANYLWDFGDGNVGSDLESSHVYGEEGIYSVCLSVMNDCDTFQYCKDLILFYSFGEGGLCEDEWGQFINGDNVAALLEIGNFIWAGTDGGGLVKLSKMDGSVEFFNTSNSGLPNNRIRTLLEDANADIWIGTDDGLVKFDGMDWELFNASNSGLPNNKIQTLLEDTIGNIWIGTNNGLVKFDGSNWQTFNALNSDLPSNSIRPLLEDSNGKIWIGTDGAGVTRFDGTNWDTFHTLNSILPSNYPQAFLEDNDGSIWIGTTAGLAKYDNGSWNVFYASNSGLPSNYIKSLLEDNLGNIWIGTGSSLVQYDGSNWDSSFGLFGNVAQSLLEDNLGNIWIGTSTSGLIKYDGLTQETFNTSTSDFPDNSIQSFLEDDLGNIWIGSHGGLLKYDGLTWEVFNTWNSGLLNNYVGHLLEDTNGHIWIGSGSGLTKYDGTNWETLDTSNSGLPDNDIQILLEDINGNIWIATAGGLTKYNNGGWETFTVLNSILPNNTIHNLLEANDGHIWIGTDNGLVKYNGTNLEAFNATNSPFSNDVIISFFEDMDGSIWIGKNNGLVKYSDGNWETFNTLNSDLPSNVIYGIWGSNSGHIWMSTDNGLVKKDSTNWVVFNALNSVLPNHIFRHFLEDNAGNIWIGSAEELAKYDGISWSILNTSNSGLPNNDINNISEDGDGNIWVGTNGGIGTISLPISPNFESIISCSRDSSYFENKSYHPTQNEWRINGETVSYEKDLIYYFEESGVYEITLIASNEDECTDVYKKSIRIPTSVQELENHLPEYISICGDNAAIVDLSMQNYASYQWTDNLGTLIDTTAVFTTSTEGLYYLTVVDSCDISITDSIMAIIDEDCVWPGDTNKDGVVNHKDLIGIGLLYDEIDSARLGRNTDFIGQGSTIWGDTYSNNIDDKHTDTNGDGEINDEDIDAININYGKTYGNPIATTKSSPVIAPYSLIPVFEGIDTTTGTIQISVDILSNNELYHPFYGIAFRLDYESPSAFDTLSHPLEMNLDLLGSDAISIHQQFQLHTDLAFVRTNHQDIAIQSSEEIGISSQRRRLVKFGIIDLTELPGGDSGRYLRIMPREVLMVNAMGDTIPVGVRELDIYLPDESLSFVITTEPISCNSLGSVTIHPLDIGKSYSYLWSTGGATRTISSLSTGILGVSVTDNDSGEILDFTIDIEGMGGLEVEVVDDGTMLSAEVTGGDGNYLYYWDSDLGETTASIPKPQGLDVIPDLNVMDGNGCEGEVIFTKHIYVDHTATGNGTGNSWVDAFIGIQDAITINSDAATEGFGSIIHIAEGTYYPTSGSQRGASFRIPNNCRIIGGYPTGGGTVDLDSYETILSGDINQDFSLAGNSYHVVFVKDVNNVVLEGISIKNGNANNVNSFGRSRGGGIFVNNATLTLKNVSIEENYAIYGAGIFATLSDSVSIHQSLFSNNSGDYGSAIYHSNQTRLYIYRTKVLDNTSNERATIEVNNSEFTRIENSVIASNPSHKTNTISFISTNRNGVGEIVNCTILGDTLDRNLITVQVGYGDQLDLSIDNSIIAHQDVNFSKALKAYNNGTLNLITNHCYIQGTTTIGATNNNLYSDTAGELLLNPDFSLFPCSPGVDSGSNTLIAGLETDFQGKTRILNAVVDMGAYEVKSTCEVTNSPSPRNQNTSEIRIFPNPVHSHLQIETNLKNLHFELHDVLGKVVAKTNSKELDMNHLPTGIYILRIMKEKELIDSRKVVKE